LSYYLRRTKNVKNLIESGRIVAFRAIFTFKAIPKIVLANDLGMHQGNFDKFLAASQKFTLAIAFHIAAIFDTDRKKILDLLYDQAEEDRKKR